MRRAIAAVLLALGCTGAPRSGAPRSGAPPVDPAPASDAPPAGILGTFVDDYGNRYTIEPGVWTQHPHGRFIVTRWNPAGRYLIARNDPANGHAPGRWTRIDWVTLRGMAPWTWAFCLSAYDSPTAEAAESTLTARTDTPLTGCNGYPFSRMRRTDGGRADAAIPARAR